VSTKDDVAKALSGFKSLSDKSLKVVYEWAESNEPNPLASAYLGACGAVGSLDCSAIAESIEMNWRGSPRKRWDEAYKPYYLAFVYRDTIGRMILNEIKRTNAAEQRKPQP